MRLLIDIGNSNTKLGIWRCGKLSNLTIVETENILKSFTKYKRKSIKEIFFTSVIALSNNRKILAYLKKNFKSKIFHIKSSKSLLEIENAYKQPEKLGSDRWCAIVGAYRMYKKSLLIIDCGTAISIDCVNKKGRHLGGYILCGLNGYLQSFHNVQNIKKIKLKENNIKKKMSYAKTTEDALISGYILMITSTIENIYAALCSKVKTKPTVIISGGYGKLISTNLSIKAKYEPNLVLKSLGLISDYQN